LVSPAAEKMQDIPLDVYMQAHPEGLPGGKWRRLASRLTLNGHLLPQCFFHKGYVRQFKGWGGRLQETFRFRKVLYVHAPTHRGFFLQHDKRKFFAYLWRYCKAVWQLPHSAYRCNGTLWQNYSSNAAIFAWQIYL